MKLSNLIALLTNRTVAGNAYVKDGELYQGNTSQAILVKDENELDEVKKHVAPGSIAYTAGCASVWQLDASGTWQEIQEEGGGGSFAPDITNPQDGDTLVYNATAGKWVNGTGGGGGTIVLTPTVGETSIVLDITYAEAKAAMLSGRDVVFILENQGTDEYERYALSVFQDAQSPQHGDVYNAIFYGPGGYDMTFMADTEDGELYITFGG